MILLFMRTYLTRLGSNRARVTPSFEQSGIDTLGSNAIFSRPLAPSLCFAIQGKPSIISSITRLFLMGRPTNISRLVVTIVIDPIKRMFASRPTTYRFQKVLNGGKAKFYTACSVTVVATIVGIITPLFGRPERIVFGTHLVVRTFPVCDRVFSSYFICQTAAGLGMKCRKTTAVNGDARTAVANTVPHRKVFRPPSEAVNYKPVKPTSSQILEPGICGKRSGVKDFYFHDKSNYSTTLTKRTQTQAILALHARVSKLEAKVK